MDGNAEHRKLLYAARALPGEGGTLRKLMSQALRREEVLIGAVSDVRGEGCKVPKPSAQDLAQTRRRCPASGLGSGTQ